MQKKEETFSVYLCARRQSVQMLRYYDYWIRRILNLLSAGESGSYLELMCGAAEVSRRISSVNLITAVDIDLALLSSARLDLDAQGKKHFPVICANATRLPFRNNTFDAIFIQGGLHHVKPALDLVISEISRVLKPGGVLIASEPANDNWLIKKVRHWQYSHSHHQGNDEGEDGFECNELAQVMSNHGLKMEIYNNFGYLSYPLIGNIDLMPLLWNFRSSTLSKFLIALDELFERIPFVRRFGWASLMRVRKPKE